MKIGIDARMYRGSVAGIGRYSQNLIKNLLELDKENEYVFFMTLKDIDELSASLSLKDVRSTGAIASLLPVALATHFKLPNSHIKIIRTDIDHYSLAEQTKLPKIIENEKLDLMHFLNFNYPVRYKGKFIVTIHDLTLLKFPDTAKKNNVLKKSAFNYVMNKACQNSEKIIAVSENTKRDIIEEFKVNKDKLKVIYEAADDKILESGIKKQELIKKYKIEKPVILSVGQFRPHKNLVGLVDAFEILRKDMDCQLVILGKPDPKHLSLITAIDKNRYKNDIIMPGFVSESELAAWYKIATCFVFPSLYEGFGLPGLEAMQTGLPVVASNSSVLPEIYKDAAIYFDPFKTQEISAKIKLVLQDNKLRTKLIANGHKVAQSYSWQKTAKETLKLYNEVQK